MTCGTRPSEAPAESAGLTEVRAFGRTIGRVAFITPDRSDLPPLTKYASLQVGVDRKVVGYTEATRGCKHRCRHCPIVPVYDGRFRAVPIDVVMADIRAQVAAGAQHITFGDPDFFNGPTHALAIVDGWRASFRASATTSRSRSSTCASRPRRCRACATRAARL